MPAPRNPNLGPALTARRYLALERLADRLRAAGYTDITPPPEIRAWLVKRARAAQPVGSDGVHTSHCCARHGCKYSHPRCPVLTGRLPQEYPCEQCDDEESDQ